jgi:hypothetical protein
MVQEKKDRVYRERLRPLLVDLSRQAAATAATLTPWLATAWVRAKGRHVRDIPKVHRALIDACDWAEARQKELPQQLGGFTIIWPSHGCNTFYIPELLPSTQRYQNTQRYQYQVDCALREAAGCLTRWAMALQETRLSERVIDIPDDIHPPRYGRLEDGVLSRLLAEDLAAQINAGRTLEASLAAGTPTSLTVQDWIENVAGSVDGLKGNVTVPGVLAGLTPAVRDGFARLTSGASACDNPVIADAGALGRAYLALGMAYLEEVQVRMPDYAETSGQAAPESRVSMTIKGGTFYGGQFAVQIANIDSTIAGVVQQGSPDMADALKALEQAVMSQEDLDEEQRRDLLDNVGYLAEAAQASPEKRNRGIIKSVLSALKIAATSGAELSSAMDAWGGVLHRLLS